MMRIKEKYILFLFSFTMTFIVLWNLLLPGYVMTLDTVEGPLNIFYSLDQVPYSHYISLHLNYLLSTMIGTILAQKIYIFGLFFSLFYLPVKFFPFEVEEKYKYLGALLYGINPFVLERFLAGQWNILFGYAFLWPFVFFLVKIIDIYSLDTFKKLLFTLFVIGCFSFHIFVAAHIVLAFCVLIKCVKYIFTKKSKNNVIGYEKITLFLGVLVIYFLVNLYWIYPTLTIETVKSNTFNQTDIEAFKTNVIGQGIMPLLSIFTLYGFWGERELWAAQFDIVHSKNIIFFLPILIISAYGLYILYTKNKKISSYLLCILLFSMIFSLGISETIFKNMNQFLFDTVFFWTGFRDSQKWSAFIVLILTIGLVMGACTFLQRIKNPKYLRFAFICIAVCICLYTSKILFGFNGKLSAVQYPKEWFAANDLLKQEPSCEAVFLPWHLYYFFSVNNKILTANPAAKYFDCKIYSSLDPEFHGIENMFDEELDLKYARVEEIVTSTDSNQVKISKLKQIGITHIIFTRDALNNSELLNPVQAGNAVQVYDSRELALYKI